MLQTQKTTSHLKKVKQYKTLVNESVHSDEGTLSFFAEDFGKLSHSLPAAVVSPANTEQIQDIVEYSYENGLSLTIRGKGMSQSGQALAPLDGLILDLSQIDEVLELEDDAIWVEANASWSSLLKVSLEKQKIPYVLPYNCDLTVGGVISAGGVGASSFKYGAVVANVKALEIILASGEVHRVDANSPLFSACLGGQGNFGVITKACIKLRACKKSIRTFFLLYDDSQKYFEDLKVFQHEADYIESFCTPSVQGAKLSPQGRLPFAHWLYACQISFEYDDYAPKLEQLENSIKAWKVLHTQDEPLADFLHRHDGRFASMKQMGLWDLPHPWYECFISKPVLQQNLDEILASLPLYYATIVQILPIKKFENSGFFMLPEAEEIYALMILNPGVSKALVPGCLAAIKALDARLLKAGGKRYLSGYLGEKIDKNYWKEHYGALYSEWLKAKKDYDRKNVFRSLLCK